MALESDRVEEGDAVVLQADMQDRDCSALHRMATFIFRPGRFFTVGLPRR